MMRLGAAITAITSVAIVSVILVGAQAPQVASGIPDISGSWERARDASIPAQSQAPLKPQYLKEMQAKAQAVREASQKGAPLADRATACLPEGMPAMMGATFPIEFLQSKGQVTIIEEAYTQVRRIHLDRPQKPIDDVEPSFYGYSVGKWENGALLVETVGVRENVLFQNAPHSKEMRIKERISLGANGVLRNDITIEDPVTLERPWTFTFAYRRMPNYSLLEYICEDNREYADENGLQKIRIEPAGK